MTEKLLLLCGAINMAGAVKSRKTARHATSDWMSIEQERGISVTTSVMKFTSRVLAAVDLNPRPQHTAPCKQFLHKVNFSFAAFREGRDLPALRG